MKIAQVISTPPQAWATGGCARVVYDLSRELANRGNDVTIITTDLYKPGIRYSCTIDEKDPDNITVLRFPNFSDWLAWEKKIFVSFGLLNHIRKHILEYDVVHFQDLISITAIFTSFHCRYHNKPYVLTTHGSLPWLFEKKIINKLYYTLFGKSVLLNASKYILINTNEIQLCKSLGIPDSKLHYIPNGICLQDYSNVPKPGIFKKKYGIQSDTKVLLYIGRLYHRKGLDILIRAFEVILKQYSNIKLVFVGPDDGYKETLLNMAKKAQIDSNIIFCGYLSDDEKKEAYIDADVFITPLFFGFPITFIEACLFGLPIVTTNKGDSLEWINDQVGYSTTYDAFSISEAVMKILTDEALHKKFANNAKNLVKTRFAWNVIVKEIETVYKENVK